MCARFAPALHAALRAPTALTAPAPQDGEERNYQRTDCIECNRKNFCLEHITRERRHPRKGDCAECRRAAGRLPWDPCKNMCRLHHKPDCTNRANCFGCLRKDCCAVCSGCEHGEVPRRCELCRYARRAADKTCV